MGYGGKSPFSVPYAPCSQRNGGKMETKTLSIPNISCGHCVMSIKKELSEMEGVTKVEGDPASKSVTLKWDSPATLEKIKDTLKEINYPAAD
jgi:copper chaperone